MDGELLGGPLDGETFAMCAYAGVPKVLCFSSPMPMTMYSTFCEPQTFTRVTYYRSHVKDGKVYYIFDGYAE